MLSSELQRLQSLEYSDKVTAKSEVSTATSDQVSQKKPDENVSQNVESVKRTAGGHCIATSKSTPQRYYKELMTYGKTVHFAS
jgi:hypothetical protein